jgi:hypothetical protein
MVSGSNLTPIRAWPETLEILFVLKIRPPAY